MPTFLIEVSRVVAATFTIDADNDFEANDKAQEHLNVGDTSNLEWTPVRKSEQIDFVSEN